MKVDFTDKASIMAILPDMVFIEIKTSNQFYRIRLQCHSSERSVMGFAHYTFKQNFARILLTESDIAASEALGERHSVTLFNKLTGSILLTSIPAIVSRSKSTAWQISIQL